MGFALCALPGPQSGTAHAKCRTPCGDRSRLKQEILNGALVARVPQGEDCGRLARKADVPLIGVPKPVGSLAGTDHCHNLGRCLLEGQLPT